MKLESNKTYTIITNIGHGRGINGISFDTFNKVKILSDNGCYLELFDMDSSTAMFIRWDNILSVKEYASVTVYRMYRYLETNRGMARPCKRISIEKYNMDNKSITLAKKFGIPIFETREEGEEYMHKHIPEGFHEVDYNYHFLEADVEE